MMHSLRSRLLAGTVVGTTLVLCLAGAMLYWVLQSWLRHEFDAGLAGRATLLASLVEQEDSELEFDFDYRAMPEFGRSERPEYFEIWSEDGNTVARSKSLKKGGLANPAPAASPVFRDTTLPDGRRGRLVIMRASPRIESNRRVEPQRIIIAMARETAGLDSMLRRIRWGLSGVGLAAVSVSALILVTVVGRGLRPLNRLAMQLGDLRPDDLSSRIDLNAPPRELIPVVDQLNSLLQRIEAVIRREKAFTAEVAHELRTPLAGLRSTLEVSLSRDRDAQMYRRDLAGCLEIAGHMQHMVGNLLSMARLEGGILTVHPGPVCVGALVSECWRAFEPSARAKSAELQGPQDGRVEILSDGEFLRQILTNLLDNAVTYVDPGGRIAIDIRKRSDAVEIEICNTGSKISPEQAQQVFERFWRADVSRLNASAHCGLGLPLTKLLVQRLGGTIHVECEKDLFRVITILPNSIG